MPATKMLSTCSMMLLAIRKKLSPHRVAFTPPLYRSKTGAPDCSFKLMNATA
jgi:hypothetical protein